MKYLSSFAPLAALLLAAAPRLAQAQTGAVGIGTTAPVGSAALEIRSTSQGLLLPRLSLAQRNALTASNTAPPVPGLVIYQTDNTPGLYAYDGAAWARLGGDNLGNHTATQALNLQGNALLGNGDDLGTVRGVGVRVDGGLNLGQNNGRNIYLGYQAGNVSSGNENVFSGYQSGYSNLAGNSNLFSGYQSGYSNSSGSANLFSGTQTGYSNTTGSFNLFSGFNSGYSNTIGHDNLFSGSNSGYRNTTGNNNVFSGNYSGVFNTSGSDNVFSGFQSGASNTTGSNNTALGSNSGPASGALTNTTALGNGATVSTSNTIQLGNANITSLRCQVGLTQSSDARFKYDVQANVPGLAFIQRLRPVTYRFDQARLSQFEGSGTLGARNAPAPGEAVHTGFLAQDVERAAQALHFDFDGVHAPANARDHYSLGYAQFVVPLVQAVQELSAQVETLKTQNAALQADHAALLTLQAQMARMLSEGAQAQK